MQATAPTLALHTILLCGQTIAATPLPTTKKMFYDATEAYFRQNGTRQIFNGNIVIIGGGYVMTADHISIDRHTGILEAKGNILAASEKHTLSADTARYWLKTHDFIVTNAQLIISDPTASKRLRQQILTHGTSNTTRHARRQKLWLQTRHANTPTTQSSYYLKFHSTQLTRQKQQNLLQANAATLTPCRCQDDEPPVFALQARQINATLDEHIDFNHAVLKVHGWPVLFLPFLRLPLKRKSGLLRPVFRWRKHTGFSLSQPAFVAFNPEADATIYFDWLQQHGLRLALSSRGRLSEQQHWQLLAEGLYNRHSNDNDKPPWRGTLKWRHLHFLTPRLSLGSEGDLHSDMAYNQNLYQTRRGEAPYDLHPYTARRLWLHFDHPELYIGASSHLAGDNAYSPNNVQLPANFTLQSRHLQLLNLPPLQTWTQLHLRQQHYGKWSQIHTHRQAQLHITNILTDKKILDVTQFWEVEAHHLLDHQHSQQYTWRTGLRFSLPLTGHTFLPSPPEQTRLLQHLVRLNTGIVVQPQVWKTGAFQLHDNNDDHPTTPYLVSSEVWELELEQAWRINTQPSPSRELAGMSPTPIHTPLSLRVSTTWDRRQATRRTRAKRRGDAVLPQAWSPLQLDLRLQYGSLSLRQELAWNTYRHEFEQLRLVLSLPLGDKVQLKPSWEIMPHVFVTGEAAVPRVQVQRLEIAARLARHTELQAAYATRKPLAAHGQRQYRWQVGGEYRGQQQCWGLAFRRVKDWDEHEHEASYMLSLQVNFATPSYEEES